MNNKTILIMGLIIFIIMTIVASPLYAPPTDDSSSLEPIVNPVESPPEDHIEPPREGKRLGMWMQWITELQHVTPTAFYHTYFRTPPYFAALELIYPIWHDTYPAFVAWLDSLAELTDALNVEIYVMLALDMGSDQHWDRIRFAVDTWSDHSSIYSVGVNCEHSKLHYPEHFNHAGFVTFQSISTAAGKEFICYYFQNAPDAATKSDFKWIAHVNWPYRGHRFSLDALFATNTQQVGLSAGLYDHNPDGYPDPNVPHPDPTHQETERVGWNRASIQYMLNIGFTHSHTTRRCLLFAQLDLWDDATFRHDVYQLSASYEILMADPNDPVDAAN